MNRHTRSTWPSNEYPRFRAGTALVALLVGSTALAGCSDDPKPSPTFTQPTDTTSSTATNTTGSTPPVTPTTPPVTPTTPPVTPPTPPVTPVTPTTPGTTTSNPTTTDPTSVSTDSVVATDTASDSLASSGSTSAPDDSTTLVLPTGDTGDAGTATATSETPTSEDTSAPVLDASVTDDAAVEETSDVPTSEDPVETTSAVVTSAVSSSVETSSEGVENLATNPGFEGGSTAGWAQFGAGTLAATSDQYNSGGYSGLSSGRTGTWNGPSIALLNVADTGETYHVEAWVRLSANDNVRLTFSIICNGDDSFHSTQTVAATANTWTQLNGDVALPACASNLTQLTFYVEGPATTTNIYVDDVVIYQLP